MIGEAIRRINKAELVDGDQVRSPQERTSQYQEPTCCPARPW